MVKAAEEQAARSRSSVKSFFFADKKSRLVQQCKMDSRKQEIHTARSSKPEKVVAIVPEPQLTSRLIDTITDRQLTL